MNLGPNLYEYVKNDPIRYTDPLGLCPKGADHHCPPGTHWGPYLDESEFVRIETELNPTSFGPEGNAGIAVAVGWATTASSFFSGFTAIYETEVYYYAYVSRLKYKCVPD